MSDLETNHLKLPYLAAAQAQKHVTHNEALRQLDTLVQLAVLDTTVATPPGSPAEGDRYIVAASATGAWAGQEAKVATFVDGAWAFAAPEDGWLAFDCASETILAFLSGAWQAASSGTPDASAVTYDNSVSGLTASTVQDAIDEVAAGGGGGGGAVASVFVRTGAVAAASGDYDASQIDNDSGVSGATVKDALDALNTLAGGKQPADGDLTAIAALSPTNDDILQRKSGAWTNRTPAQVKTDLALAKGDVGLGSVTNDAQLKVASNLADLANAGTARTNLGVAIGSDVQAFDADLAAIAALAPANDDIIQRKSGAWTNRTPAQVKADLALARGDVGLGSVTNDAQLKIASNLADLASAATARSNLGLGSLATLSGLTAQYLAGSALGFGGPALVNGTLVASVASNALTITVKTLAGSDPSASDPVHVCFRNVTAATGNFAVVTLTAATSLVISSGSTMGAANATPFRLWIVGFNDGGTFRLGAIKCAAAGRIHPLQDDVLASSTAEGGAGAADSAGVIYTGTAVSAKACRILAYMEWSSGLTTAGTWAIVPTKIQLFGAGIRLPGETVQTVLASTTATVTHTNSGMTDTGLSAALSPTSAANGVRVSGTNTEIFPSSTGLGAQIELLRGSISILQMSGGTIGYGSSSQGIINVPFFWLDFPGTASSVTYKTQAKAGNSSGTVNSQHNGGTSTILVEEIMA
jgi:hypothetical protein